MKRITLDFLIIEIIQDYMPVTLQKEHVSHIY